MTKVCSKCGEEKGADEFTKNKTNNGGLSVWCRICHKAYRKENREKMMAYHKDYRKANHEKTSAYGKTYQVSNREKIATRKNARYKANREKFAADAKAYKEANREKVATLRSARYKANRENILAKNKAYYEATKGLRNAVSRAAAANMTGPYMVKLLVSIGFPEESITPELIDFHRAILSAKRELRKQKTALVV